MKCSLTVLESTKLNFRQVLQREYCPNHLKKNMFNIKSNFTPVF